LGVVYIHVLVVQGSHSGNGAAKNSHWVRLLIESCNQVSDRTINIAVGVDFLKKNFLLLFIGQLPV